MAESVQPDTCRPPGASWQQGANDNTPVAELARVSCQMRQPEAQDAPPGPLSSAVVDRPLVYPRSPTLPIDINYSTAGERRIPEFENPIEENNEDGNSVHTMSATVEPQAPPANVDGATGTGSPILPATSEEKKKMEDFPSRAHSNGGGLPKQNDMSSNTVLPRESITHQMGRQEPLTSATLVQEGISLAAQPTNSMAAQPNPKHTSFSHGHVEYDRDEASSGVLRLKPTCGQWEDFPAILSIARKLGAESDGCFKVVLPEDLLGPLPEKPAQRVPANAYRAHLIDRTRIWQVGTIPTEGDFPSSSEDPGPVFTGEPDKAFAKLRSLFTRNKDRKMRDVRYRVDVPAWNAELRKAAGVPEKSPLHPLKGDKLDKTKAIIPGIHTPYVYESGPAFGATFQIHAEDFRLSSLNHLYKGRKIWVVIPSSAVDLAEEKLGRRGKCSQFMRHRAEFVFPTKLDRLSIPFRIIDQQPGETIVILPDAYHEGFSTGYTLAEAKNYAEDNWTVSSYQPCDRGCNLPTAIPAAYMELVEDGEERIDLCAMHDAEMEFQRKRKRDELGITQSDDADEHEAQRPRLGVEVATVG